MTKNKLLGLIVFLLIGLLSSNVNAQSPTIYADWTSLEESPRLIDVSYRILKCDENSSVKIHLNVFNENPTDQSISFTLSLKDSSGKEETVNKSLNIPAARAIQADCGSNDNLNVNFNLPENFDPTSTTITIHYTN